MIKYNFRKTKNLKQ